MEGCDIDSAAKGDISLFRGGPKPDSADRQDNDLSRIFFLLVANQGSMSDSAIYHKLT
jgi:hypothetical protein